MTEKEDLFSRQDRSLRNLKNCQGTQLFEGVEPREPLPCDPENITDWRGEETCRTCRLYNTKDCPDPSAPLEYECTQLKTELGDLLQTLKTGPT